jgi:hypothetical protein
MTRATRSWTYDYARPEQGGRDATWYGTLGFLAGCLALLAAAFFVG